MSEFITDFIGSQIFWCILLIGFVYFLVNNFLIPRIQLILNRRDVYVNDNINTAKLINEKAAVVEEQYEDSISAFKKTVYEKRKKRVEDFDQISKKEFEKISERLFADRSKFVAELDKMVKEFIEHDQKAECLKVVVYIIQKITSKPIETDLLNEIIKKNMVTFV